MTFQTNTTKPAAQLYRNAMANIASSVHVVTTHGVSGNHGITVTALASLTDDPPTMVLCINRQSSIHPVLQMNRRLCINVLTQNQCLMAQDFAGFTHLSQTQRFQKYRWTVGPTDQPQLTGALVHLHGCIDEHQDIGTHTAFYVRIEHILIPNETDHALLYFRRQFTAYSNQ